MKDHDRPTRASCALIDLDVRRPFPGQRVLALSIGGVLTPTIWSESQADFYDAYMEFPDVPQSVKAKQNARTEKVLTDAGVVLQ